MPDILFARQAILDANLDTVAYELLFRGGHESRADITNPDRASSNVLLNAFAEQNIDEVVGGRLAFVNFTPYLLMNPPPFDSKRLVIEVLEDIEITDAILAQLARLRAQGYLIALDDFEMRPDTEAAIECADFIKVDIRAHSEAELAELVAALSGRGPRLLAEKVETWEEFERMRTLGFELFQGYFYSRPENVSGYSNSPAQVAVVELLERLWDPMIEPARLQEVIARDAVLSVKLLRLINSAALRTRVEVTSLAQAIALLGLDRLRSWASLLALSSLREIPEELTRIALVRARTASNVSEALGPAYDCEQFFMAGLLSVVDAFFDAELGEVLDQLPLTTELRSAIEHREGMIGTALTLIEHFERGGFDGFDADVPIGRDVIAGAYAEAVTWAEAASRTETHLAQAG